MSMIRIIPFQMVQTTNYKNLYHSYNSAIHLVFRERILNRYNRMITFKRLGVEQSRGVSLLICDRSQL